MDAEPPHPANGNVDIMRGPRGKFGTFDFKGIERFVNAVWDPWYESHFQAESGHSAVISRLHGLTTPHMLDYGVTY